MKINSLYLTTVASIFLLKTSLGMAYPLLPEGMIPPVSQREPVKLLWIPLNRVATFNVLLNELKFEVLSLKEGEPRLVTPFLETTQAPINWKQPVNPFIIQDKDFYVGNHLPMPGQEQGPPPDVDVESAKWFDGVVRANALPDVFMIGGHHVISEGWHNDPETGFLYMPSLLDTLNHYQSAKKVFSSVKLAILWGCNTLTNLEPHGENGEYLDSNEIKARFLSKDPREIEKMLGTANKTNSLEFYKSRLANEYGPNSGQYEYTRDASKEKCLPGKYNNCPVTNLERILPNTGLYDGEHRYNEPARMKMLFPNAKLILGFSSASPSEETRSALLQRALSQTRADLKNLKLNDLSEEKNNEHLDRLKNLKNILYTITSDSVSAFDQKLVIRFLRKNWTLVTRDGNSKENVTFEMVNGRKVKTTRVTYRPSGSITPAFPEIDGGKVFPVELESQFPELKSLNGLYEER